MNEGAIKVLGILMFSGLIAYIGDMVGFRVGKKKISLLGLRPKQTATMITVAFGILITSLTMIFGLIVSDDVRVALFMIDNIKAEIREKEELNKTLTTEKRQVLQSVKDLNIEIIQKKKEIEKLTQFYKELKQNVIIIEINEIIAHVIIEKNTPYPEVVKKFEQLFKDSHEEIREKGIKTNPIGNTIEDYRKQINEKAKIIANSPVRFLLETVASSNLTLKSTPGNLFDIIALAETKIISAGETIKSPFYIDSDWDMQAIYNTTTIFFRQVEEFLISRKAFLNSDFFVHPIEIQEICQEIKKFDKRIYLQVNFNKNIYSLGPFNFRVEFLNAETAIDSTLKDKN
ncbi:MAG: DUF3084 domain-containing protein [Candidatus Muirbacterium halophilum]|nr:DUF3084 domain-containing protein [Candidatus Muirbacterium halophilum]MCK9477325.1 DUF3084 domain-containing protein [Candidatus Muirbacterium halophilum]